MQISAAERISDPTSLSDIAVRDEAKEVRDRLSAGGTSQAGRSETDPRFTFHGSGKRAKHDADGRGSFVTVEQSMSNRLLGRSILLSR